MAHTEAATCPRDGALRIFRVQPPGFATAAAVVCRESGAGRLLALADEALRTIPPRTSCGRVKQMHWCTEAEGLRGDGVRCAEVMIRVSSVCWSARTVQRPWLPRNIRNLSVLYYSAEAHMKMPGQFIAAVPAVAFAVCLLLFGPTMFAQPVSESLGELLEGKAAFSDWRADAPLVRRKITELPPPNATRSASNPPRVIAKPASAAPKVPPGFQVELFATNLRDPRTIRVAPNGDIFIAESEPGRIRVLRATDGAATPRSNDVFASGLDQPFGIAFYPPGSDPQWIHVANTGSVVRYPYRSGDVKARGKAEVIVRDLPHARGRSVQRGHITRDIVFSGRQMFVSVGSASNDGEEMGKRDAATIARWEAEHGLGTAWGNETDRAAVLVFDPEGRNRRVFASGLRNCVGLAVHPMTGDVWCSTNERDDLGDDLVPDFVTRVRDSAFYGWPWYYVGANEDPRHRGERPDLKDKITVPDVLIQAHSASMGMIVYDGDQFPSEYSGDVFAAEHGSWNRSKRTGYKVIRVRLEDGVPTGEYEDFMTGFVVDDSSVWAHPVGVAVAHDGALLVSEDGNGTIWRVSYRGGP